MYPKVVGLSLNWCIFSGTINERTWGKGRGAYPRLEDNIVQVNDHLIRDRTNATLRCELYPDVPQIVSDILQHGAKLAIISRHSSRAMIERALYYFIVKDNYGHDRRLIELVTYLEVYNRHKTEHFRAIQGYNDEPYMNMILFDHMKQSTTRVEMLLGQSNLSLVVHYKSDAHKCVYYLGVTFEHCPDGLNWNRYQEGIATWRRTKALHSPWRGPEPTAYPKRKLIGYSGMDLDTIKLLEKGGRRQDRKEAARWGYAMYVADDPRVAKYFSDWIKIWVPDNRHDLKTNVNEDEVTIADSDLKRDKQVSRWGVSRPYVLFCRHPNMGRRDGLQFPIPDPQRFNELVIYGQTQESLIVIQRMTDAELVKAIRNNENVQYEHKIPEWNITVPEDTKADFRQHHEHPTYLYKLKLAPMTCTPPLFKSESSSDYVSKGHRTIHQLDRKTWGKGHGAHSKIEDNIIRVNDHVVQAINNASLKCKLYPDVPRIVGDILQHGAKLAIVSRHKSKAMVDRALYYFKVKDRHGKDRRLIELVTYDENTRPSTFVQSMGTMTKSTWI
ncbi:hypothetical protein CVT24_000409 [Panaeolus cyanescens]|uniref:Uncharacterized protein n=1 Tax=Panaeolus cyanescens TaxID=181874 RepID=A0A409YDM6_9AGAR|nr:hypothetical protein CVT24_000409 [Panaeolus cyanescens]